jgi:histidyl-tRNA synthetase
MLPDSEVLAVVCEALTELEVGEFTVKVRRRFLDDTS